MGGLGFKRWWGSRNCGVGIQGVVGLGVVESRGLEFLGAV